MSPSGEPGSRYRFGPRERGGALAGWRAGQIMTVAVGLVFGVLVLRWEPNAVGVAAAVGILVLYGALATVPGGRAHRRRVAARGRVLGDAPERLLRRRGPHGGAARDAPLARWAGRTWASCTTAPGAH